MAASPRPRFTTSGVVAVAETTPGSARSCLQRLLQVADPLRVLGPQALRERHAEREAVLGFEAPPAVRPDCRSSGPRARSPSAAPRPPRSPRPPERRRFGASRDRAWGCVCRRARQARARGATPPPCGHEARPDPDQERHPHGREQDRHVDPDRAVELPHRIAGGVARHRRERVDRPRQRPRQQHADGDSGAGQPRALEQEAARPAARARLRGPRAASSQARARRAARAAGSPRSLPRSAARRLRRR